MFNDYCAVEIDNLMDSILRVLVFQHHLELLKLITYMLKNATETYLMLLTLESALHVHWIGIRCSSVSHLIWAFIELIL